ncbi:MAG: glycosyltransferase family 4 protein [Chloroflexi bacterium]|nr:glycosyltransferase family 4 protein [Chloroflexota bacterium]
MIAPTSFFGDYGCHVRILEEARVLQGMGHRVTICTYHKGRDLPDVDIRRIPSLPWRGDYEVGSSRHKIALDALLLWRGARSMPDIRPHVIHAHLHEGALIGCLLSRAWRVPLVFDFQGSLTSEMLDHGFLSPDGLAYRPMLRLERLIDHASPRILTSSEHAGQLLTEQFGYPRARITHVPDCVNTALFAPAPRDEAWAARRHGLGIPPDRTVVVYLGLLAEYQGTSHLLRAAQRILAHRQDVHFLLGGYPHMERYRGLAQELGIGDHVSLPGRVPYEGAPDFLRLGDIAVSPKLSRTEGAGKLLNYMATGLPTVSFDTDVSREYLGELGIYAQRGDADSLAECLEGLVDTPGHREQLGAALQCRAQELYGWERAGEIIVKAYDALMR